MRLSRQDLIRLLILQAAGNGFEFPKWWGRTLQTEWPGRDEAVLLLGTDRRYYTLLFSHVFARAFFKQGSRLTFTVPGTTYTRRNAAGEVVTIKRKPFSRRTLKSDAWVYHLKEMAAEEEPLRYMKRFLNVDLVRKFASGR